MNPTPQDSVIFLGKLDSSGLCRMYDRANASDGPGARSYGMVGQVLQDTGLHRLFDEGIRMTIAGIRS